MNLTWIVTYPMLSHEHDLFRGNIDRVHPLEDPVAGEELPADPSSFLSLPEDTFVRSYLVVEVSLQSPNPGHQNEHLKKICWTHHTSHPAGTQSQPRSRDSACAFPGI